jgi:hypothetical protein
MDHRDVVANEENWYKSLDKKRMIAIVELCDEDDEGFFDEEVEIPFKFEVCETCHGKGTHVNPSIDSHGITQDEWSEWDDEEREGYFSGMYDVECYECGGDRVVPCQDYDKMTKELGDKIFEHIRGLRQSAREMAHEFEMGY